MKPQETKFTFVYNEIKQCIQVYQTFALILPLLMVFSFQGCDVEISFFVNYFIFICHRYIFLQLLILFHIQLFSSLSKSPMQTSIRTLLP